ncbi:mitochondrial ribosomal protein-like protein subunit L7 [Sphaerosporella brunnea]|uniref:Large ribosomal subunit protein uL5m n=1 Tax=Sphaerosporella brunnea TaxID=1250544 RepID=A0A5J5F2T1_9PEZI|nr:mitochondrial ribosomal protein-like protein subunit L7 [Sphaerosporella brunnea]
MSLLASSRSVLGRSPLTAVPAASLGLRHYAKKAEPKKLVFSASSPSKKYGKGGRARYQFRPPRYYRGPLHPIQPPKPSSPNSREFIPGPFGRERLQDHYHDTLAADLLTLTYTHLPPGVELPKRDIKQRLREWDDSSPYHKNRPLRGPRGGDTLRLLNRPRTFRNVPELTAVTVHSMVKGALNDSGYLAVAGMVVQSITGARTDVCFAKKSVAPFDLRAGRAVAVKVTIKKELAWRFVSNLVDVVMPRIKEYQGVKGTSGDSSGNITFGFTPEQVSLFPEIEVNYDMYPPKMIPGFHVTLHTSATNDKDGRKLLQAFGIPFYGQIRD